MKLSEKQRKGFELIGAAIVAAKSAAKVKKDAMTEVKDVLAANKEAFAAGVTIGKYKFNTVERIELAAIEV